MRRASCWLAVVTALAVPFWVFSREMLFHFYVRGAFVLDSGQLAYLLWHSDLGLTEPLSLGGGSFFAIHVVPLFWLISAVSWVVPGTMAGFFALFIGFCHALLAGAIVWLLIGAYRTPPWIAAMLGIGFACSGLAIAIARFPHFETLIPAFFLLFLTARRLGHTRLAILFFVLGLTTREDAGLHYALILLLIAAWNRWTGAEWRFAVVALVYVAAAMVVQRLLFPGASAFVRVYLGDPPLAHLTAASMTKHVLNLFFNRLYLLLPFFGACAWAILARNRTVLLGYVASLPWLCVQLLAVSMLASMVSSYYAFPFLIAMAWPLYADARPIAFAGLLVLSFAPNIVPHNPGKLFLPEAVLNAPSAASQAAMEHAVAAIVAARPALGKVLADNSVAALAPNGFTRAEVIYGDRYDRQEPPDTIAYMTEGYDAARLRAIDGLTWRYMIPGTPIHLASRRSLDGIPALGGLIMPERTRQYPDTPATR